ncbi:hypothetical protein M0813_06238 [Anaeramoeba flamelloides]|uniref:Uncharacterized protein n=1 Tax=Anaeramoeba flamelloides TaxID=1746091 RepID=A0ABQ8XHH9_9EUKA|nr:hypothetical protein M0813_06238 [Anaeramoeba flamelloides]
MYFSGMCREGMHSSSKVTKEGDENVKFTQYSTTNCEGSDQSKTYPIDKCYADSEGGTSYFYEIEENTKKTYHAIIYYGDEGCDKSRTDAWGEEYWQLDTCFTKGYESFMLTQGKEDKLLDLQYYTDAECEKSSSSVEITRSTCNSNDDFREGDYIYYDAFYDAPINSGFHIFGNLSLILCVIATIFLMLF